MGPYPTRAYFWLAVNKRPTCLWPRYFLTRGENIEKFDVFRRNFPNPNHIQLTQPYLTRATKNWPEPITTLNCTRCMTFSPLLYLFHYLSCFFDDKLNVFTSKKCVSNWKGNGCERLSCSFLIIFTKLPFKVFCFKATFQNASKMSSG